MSDDTRELELDCAFAAGGDFLGVFSQDTGPARLSHWVQAGRGLAPEILPGAQLTLRLRFLDRDVEVRVHALVTELLRRSEQRGVRLELSRDEQSRIDLAIACARGESIPYFRRRHPRLRCRLPITLAPLAGGERQAVTANISCLGLRVRTSELMAAGAALHLTLPIGPERAPVRVGARVLATTERGPDVGMSLGMWFAADAERVAMAERVALLGVQR